MFRRYYRRPKTTNERRANGSRKDHELAKWRRAKRSACNIPNSWDDIPVDYHNQRNWKSKRKNQYYSGGRGKKYVLHITDGYVYSYTNRYSYREYQRFLEYLEEYGIPYVEEQLHVTEVHTVTRYNTVWYEWGDKPLGKVFYNSWNDRFYQDIPYTKKEKFSKHVGTTLTYWSHKKIDLTFWDFGVVYE